MLQKFNRKKIEKLLKAAENTNYYKKVFTENNININGVVNYEDFCRIPITTKNDYKNHTLDFIVNMDNLNIDKVKIKALEGNYKALDKYLGERGFNLVMTSGSTGIPLEVIHSNQDDVRNYFCLNYFRSRLKSFDILSKYIWILPMNKKTQSEFYSKDQSYIIDGEKGIQYFLTNYNDVYFNQFHKVLTTNNIKWICGSPTAIVEYCNYLERNKIKIDIDYVELHSEPSLDWQVKIIKNCLGVSPVSIYSSNEINFIAATCSDGNYHVFEDNVFVELVDKQYGDKNIKKVLITGLNYLNTPIIRYDIGDLAVEIECSKCGAKSHNAFQLIGYRDSDMIVNSKNDLIEPYIIYDAVHFLEKKLSSVVGYYQSTQLDHNTFKFEFESFYNWDSDTKHFVKEFLENFLTAGIEEPIQINLSQYDKNDLVLCRRRSKYKRLKSEIYHNRR